MSFIYFLLIFMHAPLCFVHSRGFPRKVSGFYNPEGCKQAGFFHPLTAVCLPQHALMYCERGVVFINLAEQMFFSFSL